MPNIDKCNFYLVDTVDAEIHYNDILVAYNVKLCTAEGLFLTYDARVLKLPKYERDLTNCRSLCYPTQIYLWVAKCYAINGIIIVNDSFKSFCSKYLKVCLKISNKKVSLVGFLDENLIIRDNS
jgi:hypothetical protein